MKSDKELRKVKLPDERADIKNGFLAVCSQEIPCKMAQETLEKVTEIMNEEVNDTVSLLKALADPIRLRILKALCVYRRPVCLCLR